ncbi:hypothetical protein IE53DRAFT_401363 [Violaceomyces palustris]|uniref:Uncharacterized protein n=1 Tax=Violaceomyces palustris TaxID=1673888 RepID=A0ACD0NPQ0_9BASI|nr:hypothetical protein IE53DRAFT_401363 [Violaceomyces palustris]
MEDAKNADLVSGGGEERGIKFGLVSVGNMGAPLGGILTSFGHRVASPLSERSEASRRRALDFGIEDCHDLESLIRGDGEGDWQGGADIFLSILPPSQAVDICERVAKLSEEKEEQEEEGALQGESKRRSRERIFVDLNAISPQTSERIKQRIESVKAKGGEGVWKYVDGSIIGLPPRWDDEKAKGGAEGSERGGSGSPPTFCPTIYLSSPDQDVLERLGAILSKAHWKVRVIRAPGEDDQDGQHQHRRVSSSGPSGGGESKALKLCNSAFLKGLMGIGASSVLAVALTEVLNSTYPGVLDFLSEQLPNVAPKSYRFGGEMLEIEDFFSSMLTSSAAANGDGRKEGRRVERGKEISQLWRSMARVFDNIAEMVEEEERQHQDAEEGGRLTTRQVLESWSKAGREILEE